MDGDQIGGQPAQWTNAALTQNRRLPACKTIQHASDFTARERRKAQTSRTQGRAERSPGRTVRPPRTDPERHRMRTESTAQPGPGTIARNQRRRRRTPLPTGCTRAPTASIREPHPRYPVRSTEPRLESRTGRKPEPGGTAKTTRSRGQRTRSLPSALTRPLAETRPRGRIAPVRRDQPSARMREQNHQSDGKAETEPDGDPGAQRAACRSADPHERDEEDRTQECGRTATTSSRGAPDERLRPPRSDRSTRRTQASA